MSRRVYADGSEAPPEVDGASSSVPANVIDGLRAALKSIDRKDAERVLAKFANDNGADFDDLVEQVLGDKPKADKKPAPPPPPTDSTPAFAGARHRASSRFVHGLDQHRGLQGLDLIKLQKMMGTFKASSPKTPHINERGEFVLPTITPTEHRRLRDAAHARGERWGDE